MQISDTVEALIEFHPGDCFCIITPRVVRPVTAKTSRVGYKGGGGGFSGVGGTRIKRYFVSICHCTEALLWRVKPSNEEKHLFSGKIGDDGDNGRLFVPRTNIYVCTYVALGLLVVFFFFCFFVHPSFPE